MCCVLCRHVPVSARLTHRHRHAPSGRHTRTQHEHRCNIHSTITHFLCSPLAQVMKWLLARATRVCWQSTWIRCELSGRSGPEAAARHRAPTAVASLRQAATQAGARTRAVTLTLQQQTIRKTASLARCWRPEIRCTSRGARSSAQQWRLHRPAREAVRVAVWLCGCVAVWLCGCVIVWLRSNWYC